jgi:hypothetical protein
MISGSAACLRGLFTSIALATSAALEMSAWLIELRYSYRLASSERCICETARLHSVRERETAASMVLPCAGDIAEPGDSGRRQRDALLK